MDDWTALGSIYSCQVRNTLAITSQENAMVTSISGSHMRGKSNDDVLGFWITAESLHFFPQGLEKKFKNLQAISVYTSHLKQITQADLQVFPNLAYFESYANDIKELDQGLFDYNPNMKYISFASNGIAKVYPYTFDHLDDLIYLHLQSNICINTQGSSKAEVQKVIQQVNQLCQDPNIKKESLVCPASCSSQMRKMDRKIENLEKKLAKVMKALNIGS